MKLLTKDEYQSTLFPNMINITHSAHEIVDLWGYVDPIIESEYHNCSAWDWNVHHIYESPGGEFQHIGIAVPIDDTYLIIVVDKFKKEILGHYILSLGQK